MLKLTLQSVDGQAQTNVPGRCFVAPFGLVFQDNCVHVWDVEKASTTCTIFGPHICGDAVDVVGGLIVTGSWRDDSQVRARRASSYATMIAELRQRDFLILSGSNDT